MLHSGFRGQEDRRTAPVAIEAVERRIYLVRSQKVMLDFDLAKLDGVETRSLNQAVSATA